MIRTSRSWGVLAVILFTACGGAEAGKAAETGESVATGRDCASAQANCGGGRCVVEVDNACKTPVTCKLSIESLCQTAGGETGPANAATKPITQLAGTKNAIEAQTNCEGTPVVTRVVALECQ